MLKNFVKIAFRNIRLHKAFAVINVAGLAIGMTCAILILLWVEHELSYDGFHQHAPDIYRIIIETETGGTPLRSANTPNALGPALKAQYPEMINFTRYMGGFSGWLLRSGEKAFENDRWAAADTSFFSMFSFPFLRGEPKTALKERFNVVITEKMAQKYFGDEMPLGKIISKDGTDLKVSGVIEVPPNSHLQFDYIFPIINMKEWFFQNLESWEIGPFKTYVQLAPNRSLRTFGSKIATVLAEHQPQAKTQIQLQPLKKVHLHTDFQDDAGNYGQGNIFYIYILALVAAGILLLACINFMNLSTARATNRAKEIGIRKVVGARRPDIIKQFLGEALLFAFISLVVAIILVELFLPYFNGLTGKKLAFNFMSNFKLGGSLVLLTILTGFIAGSYPALFLSTLVPMRTIQANGFSRWNKSTHLRRVLVVIQFIFTIILIFSTTVIFEQFRFIKNKDLGYDKENIIFFYGHGKFLNDYESARAELLQHPHILNISKAFPPFFPGEEQTTDVTWQGKVPEQNITLYHKVVDYDYLSTFGMQTAEGRFFKREFTADVNHFVINETAANTMGLKNPVGKQLTYRGRTGEIIGVLKDFHHQSLHSKILPFVFELYPGPCYVCVKLASADISRTLKFIETKFQEFVPDRPFTCYFFDEMVAGFYRSDQKIGTIVHYFTGLTIFIACLGLLGLTSFMVERRTKEIGIRKVLGASVNSIVFLLTRQISKWVLLANLFAWPLAWYLMNRWLENFAYRININGWVFLISGGLALVVAWLITTSQALKAATTNTVEVLKYE